MGSRLSKNILKIGLIESGSLAKFWSDWRSVTKVIEHFLKPFWLKQALVIYLLLIGLKNNAHGWEMGWNYRSHVPSIRSELLELRVEGGFRLHYLPISRSGIFRFVHVHVFLLDFPISADSDRQLSGNGQSDSQFSSQSFGLAVSGNCQTDSKFAGQDRRTDDIQHICIHVHIENSRTFLSCEIVVHVYLYLLFW